MAVANALGFDLAGVYSAAESIKTARLNREIGENNLKKDRAAQARDTEARDLRAAYQGGDEAALPALATLDPAKADDFMATLANMTPEERAGMAANAESMGRMAAFVLQADDKQGAWDMIRSQIPADQLENFPVEYNENMARFYLAQATEMDDIIKQMNSETNAETEQENALALVDAKNENTVINAETSATNALALEETRQENRLVLADANATYAADKLKLTEALQRETDAITAAAEAEVSDGGRVPKPSDSNSIRSASSQLFGGMYTQQADGSFGFSGLDKDSATRALAVASAAEAIWIANPSMGHSQAVNDAAKQFGFDMPNASGQTDGEVEAAPRDPSNRTVGTRYRSPNGAIAVWTSNGWVME